jgi:predicted transcriptional regulator
LSHSAACSDLHPLSQTDHHVPIPVKRLHANPSLSHANRVSGRAFPARRVKTSAEIAQILGLTKRTVDFHIDNARIKLGATTRTQAAIKATAGRLIEP